jgi:hypothetical protein
MIDPNAFEKHREEWHGVIEIFLGVETFRKPSSSKQHMWYLSVPWRQDYKQQEVEHSVAVIEWGLWDVSAG